MIVAIEQVQGVGYQPAHGPARLFPGYGACAPAEIDAVVKTQRVRIVDVALIGPLTVWAGWKLRRSHPLAASLLAIIGASTVLYNARNYAIVRDTLRAER